MADNQTTAAEPTNGRVTRVQGSVIDVEFPVGHLPDIYNALKVTIVNTSAKEEGEAKETEITLEVEQHLGDSTVRCVALKPTDGLVRGASVSDTGAPISVPVGDVTKGHVFDVSGNILNKKPDETITVSERWPIHRNPPAFDQLESKTQPLCAAYLSRNIKLSKTKMRISCSVWIMLLTTNTAGRKLITASRNNRLTTGMKEKKR